MNVLRKRAGSMCARFHVPPMVRTSPSVFPGHDWAGLSTENCIVTHAPHDGVWPDTCLVVVDAALGHAAGSS